MKQKNHRITEVNQEETRSNSQFPSNAEKHQNLDLSNPPRLAHLETKAVQKKWLYNPSGQILQRQIPASRSTDQEISGIISGEFKEAHKRTKTASVITGTSK